CEGLTKEELLRERTGGRSQSDRGFVETDGGGHFIGERYQQGHRCGKKPPSLATEHLRKTRARHRSWYRVSLLLGGRILVFPGLVHHMAGCDVKPSPHFFSYLPFDPHLIESFCHTTEPSFRPLGSDGEGQVASPHPRGTVFPGIKGR